MLSALADLAFPSRCAGCSAGRGPVCGRCRRTIIRPRRHRPDPAPPGLPPIAVAAEYAGVARACLLAYKERGRRDLAGPLAVALAAAIEELEGGPVWLVPIPSANAVARRRGGQHVERLARHAYRILRRRGVAVRVAPVLALASDRPDTAELTAAERGIAAAGKFVARPQQVRPSRSMRMVIVDDLVTTGNTVAAAAAALRDAGLPVAGAAAVAGTQRRMPWCPQVR